ncbi:30S ribosomal protein S4e [Halorussus salinisoli]|uniref:30S ribosomal protein S4e n=1 Tax=Halorussus salinisoli TaxID=2558242 RepID=UPI0010C1DF83|nr:30S ribosomal protein S4e [Halorussus salinisoli]
MTKHQKRLSVPKSWPVERKTETFTVKADSGPHGEDGVPLIILLRDVLGYVQSRKEARYALDQGNVLVNGDENVAEDRPIGMFDIVAFTEREEYYRVFPDEGGRLALTEIDGDAAGSKLGKIEDKTKVAGDRTQLNLHDGQNLLLEDASEYDAGDSIVISNDDSEVVAHFPYEEGSLVTAVRGAHAGEIGEITEIQVTPGSGSNNVVVELLDGDDTFETVEEYVVVIDENFVGDADASETPSGEDREDGGDDE